GECHAALLRRRVLPVADAPRLENGAEDPPPHPRQLSRQRHPLADPAQTLALRGFVTFSVSWHDWPFRAPASVPHQPIRGPGCSGCGIIQAEGIESRDGTHHRLARPIPSAEPAVPCLGG